MDPILIQKQVRDNSDELRSYLKELTSWEDDMKRKESSKHVKESKQEISEVRAKIKKVDSSTKKGKDKKPVEKIRPYDYKAWDKFDADAECEKIDNEKKIENEKIEAANESSDSDFDPTEDYQARLRDEATYEKERGNQFVKQQKWSDAISCYTHAIACYPKDPIFFANRALCYLKKDDLHSAEADCTSALQFDPNYVKALQRRAAARTGLKQLNDAVIDLKKVLQIEPNNNESRKELERIEKVLGTHKKETITPTEPLKYIPPQDKKPFKKVEAAPKYSPPKEEPKVQQIIEEIPISEIKIPWPPRPNAKPVRTIQKLPHLRSKTPLHSIKVKEFDGIERKIQDINKPSGSGLQKNLSNKNNTDKKVLVEDLGHLHTEKNIFEVKSEIKKPEIKLEEKTTNIIKEAENFNFPVPKSSVQFTGHWKQMKSNKEQKFLYLKQMNPLEIPNIFQEAMESELFGDIMNVLADKFIEQNLDVFLFLKYLAGLKRFSTLTMFMSTTDKIAVKKLFDFCVTKNISAEEIGILRKKYEV